MAVSFCGKRLLFRNSSLLQLKRSNGYIVLVPEIGEDFPEKNPLLTPEGLPEFNSLTIEKCVAAISQQTIAYEENIKNIEDNIGKVKNVITDVLTPLEHVEAPLELTWGMAKTIYFGNNTLMPTKSYMQIHERAFRARSSKFRSIPIFNAIVKAKNEESSWTEEEARVLDKYVLEGRLNGLNLDENKRNTLNSILTDLQKERKMFGDRVDISGKQFAYTVRDNMVTQNFPDPLLRAMAADIKEPSRGPWKVTLQPNVYEGFMQYCPDKEMRYNAWQAQVRRASSLSEQTLDNSSTLEKIRSLRHEQANILGYKNFVDMSLQTKMAGNVENVNSMLTVLLERARPMQDVELENLYNFAKERGFNGPLETSDIPFWKTKQRRSLYNYAEEELKEYFPLPAVMKGLFDLCCDLFEIQIVERENVDVWHNDVRYFDILQPNSRTPIAGFYLDPYARQDEKIKVDDSGWMLSMQSKSSFAETTPLSTLIFNFPVPIYGKPSLLTFRDVKQFFHKFGQNLRHLLTEANFSDVAGLSNVEWDTVEVCGHVMTHWLYEPKVLKSISSHYTTQECLSDKMINDIQNVRTHMPGYDLCKELYLADFDIQLHSTDTFWRTIVKNLWPKYNTIPLDKNDSHPCSFTRIFSENFAASQFGEIWSRAIAADAFSAFYEVRHDEAETLEVGRRFRDTFLASGGSCHSNQVFRRFRGRDPSHKALLHSVGLKKSAVKTEVKA